MEWTTGERADAHQVIGVLREKFARPEKRASREFLADYFRAVGATSVLGLWGGGASDDAFRAAMPDARIVSVENGSVVGTDWFRDRLGREVSKDRLKRAHQIAADEGGYEARWGDVRKVLGEPFDAAWLDFCAQWSPAMEAIVSVAGRSVQYLAVSVMPERDGLGSLGLHNRLVGLAAIICAHTDMMPTYVTSYQRNELGQDMALLVFESRRPSGDGREGAGLYPSNVLNALRRRGMWASSRLGQRHNLLLLKCDECDATFTYQPSATGQGNSRRSLCEEHRSRAAAKYAALHNLGGTCEACSGRFEGRKRRFCTERCRESLHRPAKPPCKVCGNAILLPGYRFTCSPACQRVNHNGGKGRPDRAAQVVSCAQCGEEFLRSQFGPRKFCSASCRKANEQPRIIFEVRVCGCGAAFTPHTGRQRRCRTACRSLPAWRECPACLVVFARRGRSIFCSRRCRNRLTHLRYAKRQRMLRLAA